MVTGGQAPSAPWGGRAPVRPADRVRSIPKPRRAPLPQAPRPVGMPATPTEEDSRTLALRVSPR